MKRGVSCVSCLSILAFSLLIGFPLLMAQSGTGVLNGTVTDASGAVIPGVEMSVTNKATGVLRTVFTGDSGVYRLPYLPAGTYRVSAALPGFKTAVADNVRVLLTQVVTVNLVLEVGEVSEEVTVTSEGPLLETDTSEIGINTTEKEVHTWPILVGDGTRQLQDFVFRALPGTQGGTFAGSINGGQSYSHEILIEGITIGRMDLNGGSNNEFTPTMDAVSEFKLQTGALSAQYGNTQTALTNFGMKSGTNAYHGTVFWFHRNKVLNANSWTNNLVGNERSPFLDNNFGLTVGGPIIRDKTHFFFSYEGERFRNQSVSGFETLPVAPFKQGDFSRLLDPAFTGNDASGTTIGTDALGRPVIYGQIYNPATSRQLADGTWIRDPFDGNIVPNGQFSGVSLAALRHDIPNPLLDQFRRNHPRVGTCCPQLDIDNWSLKVDHVVNEEHKLSGTFVQNDRGRRRYGSGTYRLSGVPIPGPAMAGDRFQDTPGQIVRLSEDWTASVSLLNHFSIGYNRFMNQNQSNSFLSGTDWCSELGMSGVGCSTFPQIRLEGNNSTLSGGYARLGDTATGSSPSGSWVLADDLTWLRGNHSFRFGFERRWYYRNERSTYNAGTHRFHNENTALPGFADETGFAYASFLLGVHRQADVGIPELTPGIRSRVTTLYVQDDWKVRPNLSFNLGLRWDIPEPLSEATGRMSSLDPDLPNPGADGYPGALAFRGKFGENYYRQFSPRIGFAWSPNDSIVLRGGYGINFSPPIMDGFSFPYTAGFDGSNPVIRRTGRFTEDPVYNWDNPYPAYGGELPNTDPAQLNGDTIGYYIPETKRHPYVQNWNLGLQVELGWKTKLEANYVGNKGTRLNEVQYLGSLNQVHSQYLSLGDALLDDIDDHPEIAKPYPSFSGTVAEALRPFPQFFGVETHRLNNGYSTYHSLQGTFTRRTDFGLSFIGAYTFSKALGTADTSGPGNYYDYGQDFYNRKSDFSVTAYHVPHDVKLSWIYDLPFGPGGRWATTGWASQVIGGWTVSAIHRYRSGDPLSLGTGGFEGDALFNPSFRPDVVLSPDQHKVTGSPAVDPDNGSQYLNPAAFQSPPKTANRVPIRLGNGPRYLSSVRNFAIYNEDLSLMKRTDLGFREGAQLEIRIDVINLFNRSRLAGPETDVNDSEFGKVFGKVGGGRNLQFGLRVNF